MEGHADIPRGSSSNLPRREAFVFWKCGRGCGFFSTRMPRMTRINSWTFVLSRRPDAPFPEKPFEPPPKGRLLFLGKCRRGEVKRQWCRWKETGMKMKEDSCVYEKRQLSLSSIHVHVCCIYMYMWLYHICTCVSIKHNCIFSWTYPCACIYVAMG